MIYNEDFLKQLDFQQHQTTHVKITLLTKNEEEIEEIQGLVTKGNLNVDSKSSLRRTCSLSLITNKINLSNYMWSLNNKFKLEIGLENFINDKYDKIIWFPQGIFVITDFSSSLSTNSYTINISGKDKMCLLNGEVGGIFNSQVDFGNLQIDDFEKNLHYSVKIPVKKIIREMIHQYGNEPFHNIIINDLDDTGLELLEYRLDTPLYIWKRKTNNIFENGTIDGNMKVHIKNTDETLDSETVLINISDIGKYGEYDALLPSDSQPDPLDVYLTNNVQINLTGGLDPNDKSILNLDFIDNNQNEPQKVSLIHTYQDTPQCVKIFMKFEEKIVNESYILVDNLEEGFFDVNLSFQTAYNVAKINYGDAAGYRETELVYPGDLIAKEGESITSILDKIKKMLVFYEYYYNTEGQFVFQKKQMKEEYKRLFEGSELLTTFNNNPNLKEVKNDFTVWGVRKTLSGAEIPIHMRKAIQKKPKIYNSIEVLDKDLIKYNKAYNFNTKGQSSTKYSSDILDWRELIYQMALDYRKYNHLDDFELRIRKANPENFPTGVTGYEQYYIDIEGFWRQLYNPNLLRNTNPLTTSVLYPWEIEPLEIEKSIQVNEDNKNTFIINNINPKPGKMFQQFSSQINNKYIIRFSIENNEKLTINLKGFKKIPNNQQTLFEKNINFNDITNELKEDPETSSVSLTLGSNKNISSYSFILESISKENTISFEFTNSFKLQGIEIIDSSFYRGNNFKQFWNTSLLEHPENSNFFFDLIDTEGELSQLAIEAIGDRAKVDNNSMVKAISYRETPLIIFGKPSIPPKTGYRYFNIPNYENAFSISYQSKTATDEIKQLLNNYSYCLENVSINTVPIYHLEPNSLIYINDMYSGINGNYTINKYQISLDSTMSKMSISASKNIENII